MSILEQEREKNPSVTYRKERARLCCHFCVVTQPTLTEGLGLGLGWRVSTTEASCFRNIKIISQFALL